MLFFKEHSLFLLELYLFLLELRLFLLELRFPEPRIILNNIIPTSSICGGL